MSYALLQGCEMRQNCYEEYLGAAIAPLGSYCRRHGLAGPGSMFFLYPTAFEESCVPTEQTGGL